MAKYKTAPMIGKSRMTKVHTILLLESLNVADRQLTKAHIVRVSGKTNIIKAMKMITISGMPMGPISKSVAG